MKPTIIFILGPTASGKTAVAAELARRISGEVISCDSMQVYKGMDIITQAPKGEAVSAVPHHLVRFLDPAKEYSAARYSEEAGKKIQEVFLMGHVPVLAGGTGLYVKTLVDGIFEAPSKDEELRESLKKEAEKKGPEYLYRRLEEVDPDTAAKLHPNDIKRVIRALEIYELTGATIHLKKKQASGIAGVYDIKMFGLDVPRPELYERIDGNVERMFGEGLVDEVKGITGKTLSRTASQALGIKEVSAYLEGGCSLEEAMEELKKNTRHYAKRQLTWFRADKRIVWVNAARSVGEIVEDIVGRLKESV